VKKILHILTRETEPLTREVVEVQRNLPETVVEVVDLTLPEPDYDGLVRSIFTADSVEVW
jgi:hypothetical protein